MPRFEDVLVNAIRIEIEKIIQEELEGSLARMKKVIDSRTKEISQRVAIEIASTFDIERNETLITVRYKT